MASDSNYSKIKATSLVLGTAALFGGLEALLILTLRVCFLILLLLPDSLETDLEIDPVQQGSPLARPGGWDHCGYSSSSRAAAAIL